MGVDPLEQFLREQADDGQQDSEGAFTISGDRALRKLAEYQLPRTSAWILKMIQAAVAGGATSIQVRQGAKSTRLRFKGAYLGTLEEIQEAWTSSTPTVTRAQEHLLVGLRTVAFARKRPVLLTWRHPEENDQTLLWNSFTFSPIKDADPNSLAELFLTQAKAPELSIHVASSALGPDRTIPKVKGVNDEMAAEYKELQAFAVTCPVPLDVDNRRVNHFGIEDASMHRKPLVFGFDQRELEVGQPALRLAQRFWRAARGSEGVGSAWTLYEANSPEFSKVSWVKDGVICQDRHLDSHTDRYSLRLFLPADDLDTDLTGLQLRLPPPEEVYGRVQSAVLSACKELSLGERAEEQFRTVALQAKATPWPAIFLCLAGGVAGAPATGGMSFLLGVAGAAATIVKGRGEAQGAHHKLEVWRAQLESRFRH